MEWQALGYLLFSLFETKWKSKSLCIYTDNSAVVKAFLEMQIVKKYDSDPSFHKVASSLSVSIKSISRDLNARADLLAKRGAQRSEMACFWKQ